MLQHDPLLNYTATRTCNVVYRTFCVRCKLQGSPQCGGCTCTVATWWHDGIYTSTHKPRTRMYRYIYIYTHIRSQNTYMHTPAHMYTYTHTHAYTHTFTNTHTHTHIHTHSHTHAHTHTYTYIHIRAVTITQIGILHIACKMFTCIAIQNLMWLLLNQ